MFRLTATASAILFIVIAAAAAIAGIGSSKQAGATHVTLPAGGIDASIEGNTEVAVGPWDPCVTVDAGEQFEVDVFIRGVPPRDTKGDPAPGNDTDGIIGFGFEMRYDPAVVQVTGADGSFLLTSAGNPIPFEIYDPLVDDDGFFRYDFVDLSLNIEHGDGVLVRLTLSAVGSGTSSLVLRDSSLGVPHVHVLGINAIESYRVEDNLPVTVYVGGPGPCVDSDGDFFTDEHDICPAHANPLQTDFDRDGVGDECDPDSDGDGVPEMNDLCPWSTGHFYEPMPPPVDGDGCSDFDVDPDDDGACSPGAPSPGPSLCVGTDNCPEWRNDDQSDIDSDGLGDVCDLDDDGDGYSDDDESWYTSWPGDPRSTPEYHGLDPALCIDGIDNNLNGLTDSADAGCPPDNDLFETARKVTQFNHVYLNGAGEEPGEPRCHPTDLPLRSAWFRYKAPRTGGLYLSEGGNSVLAVYRGSSLASLELITCVDFHPVSIPVARGETIYIQAYALGDGLPLWAVDFATLFASPDRDLDLHPDYSDICPHHPDPEQTDSDRDGIGDACDTTPYHDLDIESVTASPRKLYTDHGKIRVSVTLRNLAPFTDKAHVSAFIRLNTVSGCNFTNDSDDVRVRGNRTTVVRFTLEYTCAVPLAPGEYRLSFSAEMRPVDCNRGCNPEHLGGTQMITLSPPKDTGNDDDD